MSAAVLFHFPSGKKFYWRAMDVVFAVEHEASGVYPSGGQSKEAMIETAEALFNPETMPVGFNQKRFVSELQRLRRETPLFSWPPVTTSEEEAAKLQARKKYVKRLQAWRRGAAKELRELTGGELA